MVDWLVVLTVGWWVAAKVARLAGLLVVSLVDVKVGPSVEW